MYSLKSFVLETSPETSVIIRVTPIAALVMAQTSQFFF